ncbi:50S ribosomal protein L19 [Candidatus Giovannonibacteria bacterium RIFCSPHIGHO2_02_FULL_46_20]|uniref:50S ribosomal protein L19 n=1 Tax=Candidatus Giovannonibacteria bacterium RIFCSPHIGHO2_02_FULL_46_20 TaxID=1798338 RepID=A0A1F5WFT4_9BACT|nr:MAG: 50S ribosomal protein L19 [Candidatus Giovannonibacteria bacterium RIFCSPHIGHO2_02_FULL_46_20]
MISPVDIEARKSLDFRAGDTVQVFQKIREGEKTRIQVFEGLVLARKHGKEPGATFTVRKVSAGIGVERIFPLYSPEIDRIETKATARRHRRAKIYYVRDRATRDIRKKMKHIFREAKSQSATSDVTKAPKKETEEPTKVVAQE